jgi:hypothetical protein
MATTISVRTIVTRGTMNSPTDIERGTMGRSEFVPLPWDVTVTPSANQQTITAPDGTFLETVVVEGLDAYGGSYTVTPTVEGFSMPTENKFMTDDVTVNAIPYWETSNISGTTVYIANELGE